MSRHLKKRPLAKLENPLKYVFPNENIKQAMLRSYAAILVARAALMKAKADSLNVETVQQRVDAWQEVEAALRIAEDAQDEAEHHANLRRK
jgi:hypothetical protein